MAAPCTDQGSY